MLHMLLCESLKNPNIPEDPEEMLNDFTFDMAVLEVLWDIQYLHAWTDVAVSILPMHCNQSIIIALSKCSGSLLLPLKSFSL